jgi:hypothetical protein
MAANLSCVFLADLASPAKPKECFLELNFFCYFNTLSIFPVARKAAHRQLAAVRFFEPNLCPISEAREPKLHPLTLTSETKGL